jgi:NAD(P)-dependent dehydrogenase (short-subunit alcohol dehydrogenase family)
MISDGRGIGAAVATLFAREGAKKVLGQRTETQGVHMAEAMTASG